MAKKRSEEFEEKKEITDLKMQYDRERHQMKMKEMVYHRESNKIHHDDEMTRQRIKSAEIRKAQERKSNKDFAESYHRH